MRIIFRMILREIRQNTLPAFHETQVRRTKLEREGFPASLFPLTHIQRVLRADAAKSFQCTNTRETREFSQKKLRTENSYLAAAGGEKNVPCSSVYSRSLNGSDAELEFVAKRDAPKVKFFSLSFPLRSWLLN